jgi:hypothetical protein
MNRRMTNLVDVHRRLHQLVLITLIMLNRIMLRLAVHELQMDYDNSSYNNQLCFI